MRGKLSEYILFTKLHILKIFNLSLFIRSPFWYEFGLIVQVFEKNILFVSTVIIWRCIMHSTILSKPSCDPNYNIDKINLNVLETWRNRKKTSFKSEAQIDINPISPPKMSHLMYYCIFSWQRCNTQCKRLFSWKILSAHMHKKPFSPGKNIVPHLKEILEYPCPEVYIHPADLQPLVFRFHRTLYTQKAHFENSNVQFYRCFYK